MLELYENGVRISGRINATKRLLFSLHTPSGEVLCRRLPPDFALSYVQSKIDSDATSHVVYTERFLDKFVTLNPHIVMGWEEFECIVKAVGRGTLFIKRH